jgi:preprotein translocase subunit SecA
MKARVLEDAERLPVFRREAADLFQRMQRNIRREAVELFFRAELKPPEDN